MLEHHGQILEPDYAGKEESDYVTHIRHLGRAGMDRNQSLSFTLTFYHHVNYLGDCQKLNDSNMFAPPPAEPRLVEELFALFLSLVSLILNGIALSAFCMEFDHSCHRPSNFASGAEVFHRRPPVRFHRNRPHGSLQTITSFTNMGATRRSSANLGLLILCACECTYTLGRITFRLLMLIIPHMIHPSLGDRLDLFESVKATIQILPVVENLWFFVADLGLLCRNWCVCLITISRAEVILWPLGSKCWQRILRKRRWFLMTFILLMCALAILAYVKHADYVGSLCFDSTRMKFALWMQPFIMKEKQFALFELFGYHMVQSCLSWVIICLFTIIIIVQLKPWNRENSRLFSGTSENSTLTSVHSQSRGSAVQSSAVRVRQLNQIRATRAVLVIVLLFVILQFPSVVSVALQCGGYVDMHSSTMRTLESLANTLIVANSIGNFFAFIFMLKHFRIIILRIFRSRKSTINLPELE
ncbi:putative rhodopsin orphan GPCR [Fasciolopsis buskii]|uniref:Putative rhodopsin orphan GPCR n=1 Tax=Fasciolopsis buskii TaxID=27845 RepID=A0A8E0S0I5_9TREM|nr:putative rhodopsin orphan GPCR [Fasciolopsis buski]